MQRSRRSRSAECALVTLAPIALTLVAMHKTAARPFLVGLGFASAATLLVEALDPSAALIGGWLAGPALVIAAAGLVIVARQVSRSEKAA